MKYNLFKEILFILSFVGILVLGVLVLRVIVLLITNQ
jgi:hypothetical protein